MSTNGDVQYMFHYLGECNVLPIKVTQLPPGEECEMSLKLFYSFELF